MLKPTPDKFAEEDARLLELVKKTEAYDDVDRVVEENASPEYLEYYRQMSEDLKEIEELEEKGLIV
jgi:hypothetical protein